MCFLNASSLFTFLLYFDCLLGLIRLICYGQKSNGAFTWRLGVVFIKCSAGQ